MEFEDDELIFISFIGLTLMLYIRMFVRTIAMVFILNFGGGGLNLTILLFFATLSGFIYIVIGDLYYPHTLRFYQYSFVIGFFSLLLSLIPNPVISLVFAVIFQVTVTPALISAAIILQKKFSIAAIFGILVNLISLGITNFVSFYATSSGILWFVLFSLLWLLNGFYLTRRFLLIEFTETKISSTSVVIGFIAIQSVFLAYPNVLAAWYQTSIFLVTVIELLALSSAVYLLIYFKRKFKYLELTYVAIYYLGLILLIYVELALIYYVAVFLAQTTSFLLLTVGIRPNSTDSVRILGARMGGVQFLVLILIFFQIATPFWTGLPEILHSILRNNTRILTLMIGSILPVSALLGLYWRDTN